MYQSIWLEFQKENLNLYKNMIKIISYIKIILYICSVKFDLWTGL